MFLKPPPANEPDFHEVSEYSVCHEHNRDQRPVEPRKRHETEGGTHPGEGQRHSDRADDHRRRNERGTGMALDERDPRRSDDVDDERLGQKGFNEPSSLE